MTRFPEIHITKNKHGIDGGHTVVGVVLSGGSSDRDLILHCEGRVTVDPFEFAKVFAKAPVLLKALQDIREVAVASNIRAIAKEALDQYNETEPN